MRDILTSPRAIEINRRHRAKRIRLSILLLLLTLSIIGGLAYFSSDRHITFSSVVVTGNRIINSSDIQSVVEKDTTGRYFYLFDKRNSFIYPKSKIYTDLVSAFPRIQSLSIYRDNIRTLHVAIIERSGTYLYCGAQVPVSITEVGDNCYFINTDGYIFDTAPYFSGDVYFKYYIPIGSTDPATSPLGKQILTPELFHTLVRFIDGINSLGFTATHLVANPNGDYTLYLTSTGAVSPVILFNKDNDLPTILDNLALAMQKPEFADQIREKYTTLQYIDLRFNNKVLYKFN